jgi:hypothetical protein
MVLHLRPRSCTAQRGPRRALHVAVIASALYSAGAAKAQNAPVHTRPRMSYPEPEPIVVDQATADRARSLLDAVARGTFDRSELIPQLDAHVGPDFVVKGTASVSALGPPQSMFPFEKRIMADQTGTFFRVRYPKRSSLLASTIERSFLRGFFAAFAFDGSALLGYNQVCVDRERHVRRSKRSRCQV